MYNLIIRDSVYQVIDDAYFWYEQASEGLGERFLGEIEMSLNKISNNPFYYSQYKQNYHRVVLNKSPYMIVYEVFEKDVVVLAAFHTSTNADKNIR